MKICTKCKQMKDQFPKRSKAKDGLASWCTECFTKYAKEKYNIDAEERNRIKTNKNNAINKSRDYVYRYLIEHPCIICGESDPVVLEFDHRDANKKEYNVSELFKFSNKKIKEEIEKCDVLCANCHRRKTAKQFNTWKSYWV